MKNQVLEALSAINKNIEEQRSEATFSSFKESNKKYLCFLAHKFDISVEEAIFFAASCIFTVERQSHIFHYEHLAQTLCVNNFQILDNQTFLLNLVKKEILLEIPTENDDFLDCAFGLKFKKFKLHTSLQEHFN